ncbi:thimet oligopeptidase-like [Lineus longissimus]|uniref:thimet oligopeptidase-like n=1 Tax=Lineus longissimus TaxID=88925 RepID=UPI002B4ED1C6
MIHSWQSEAGSTSTSLPQCIIACIDSCYFPFYMALFFQRQSYKIFPGLTIVTAKLTPYLTVTRKALVILLFKRSNYAFASVHRIMATPGCILRWDLTANDIRNQVGDVIETSKKTYDAIGALKQEEINYDSVIQALTDDNAEYTVRRNMLDFCQHVSPDKVTREASVEVDKKLSEFDVEMSMRKDVFDALLSFEKTKPELKPEAKRFLEKLIKLGKRNGLHLSKETQDQIKDIKKCMSDLGIDFSKNLNEENTILEFDSDELAGVPEEFVKALDKTEGGKHKVSLKYPHYFPIMKKCSNGNTRRIIERAFNRRCIEENTKILEELVELREKKAKLLGFPTHAAFILDMRMAKKPERVATFLSELAVKLQPLKEQEIKQFLSYKEEEIRAQGGDFDGKLNMWDMRYYMTMAEEKMYSVDHNKLKEYFPLETVTKGLLEIYQTLLGLKFEEIEKPHVWHEDVKMYKVHDAASNDLMGYFYLDLFPREGKYGHAACFGLQPGCLLNSSKRQIAVAAMVANFSKPTEDKPALLMHDEVETYFHEFGHVMHQICAQADFCLFSGTSVERDFVEAPSQMLENWCWEKEPLNQMSGHYKDGSSIPDEMLEKLMKARIANAGLFNLRQILLGTFDQTIHTLPKADTAQIFSNLSTEILGISATPDTNMSASFGHLAGGYDAQYYGYLWSEVFCMDMFASRFKKEGIMSAKVGADYRKYILGPGGSVDANEMLRNFLGRDPQQEAFLISKGLKP